MSSLPIGEVVCGDCLEVMRDLPACSVDCIVTDPPYGLRFMGKRWDYDVPGVDLWAEVLRVLKDGGRLFCFAGSRTQHRMACAVEDAGFCIEDCMMWLYGSGFPKHGSKLKPAYEPIIVARKGKVSLLQIDAARIETSPDDQQYIMERIGGFKNTQSIGGNGKYGGGQVMDRAASYDASKGRWPANVMLDEQAAAMLDEQSGWSESSEAVRRNSARPVTVAKGAEKAHETSGHADSGGASRFFYTAKASASERDFGLRVEGRERKPRPMSGGSENAVKRGEDYDAAQTIGLNRIQHMRNHHPTVKPLALMRWLCRLAVPPGSIILDPFAGSGTTCIAAALEGQRYIGIEREPEYCEIARARIKHWTAQGALPL